MGVKKYKPTTPGQRGMTGSTFEEITKTSPEKSLLKPLRRKGGRNMQGRITVRHRGGGHRRHIRVVDFKRDKRGIPARVAAIEYDPMIPAELCLSALPTSLIRQFGNIQSSADTTLQYLLLEDISRNAIL